MMHSYIFFCIYIRTGEMEMKYFSVCETHVVRMYVCTYVFTYMSVLSGTHTPKFS